MASRPATLAVFAKVPQRGNVKTRLQLRFSADQTLAIYMAMLRDVLHIAETVGDAFDRLCLYWAGDPACVPSQLSATSGCRFEHRLQRGADLGTRMYDAVEQELSRGSKRVVLIGCDSPDLPPEIVREALDRLESAPMVFGPSEDGGYYLVGSSVMRREPFEKIDWGTARVLDQTLAALRSHGLRYELLPSWYDIDRPEDLDRLLTRSPELGAKHLRACLEELRYSGKPDRGQAG